MTIKEWEQKEIARVIRFVTVWIECNASDPENFPLILTPEEWEEQFTDGVL